ncbi:Gp37-like protein [Sinomonas soli]
MDNPFRLTIYDKAFRRVGWLGDPISIDAVPAHNALAVATLEVSTRNKKLGLLLEPGARVVAELDGDHLIGGPVRVRGGEGPGVDGTVTLEVHDDWRLFQRLLGWPVPTQPATNQSAAEYNTVTGPAETVLKTLVKRNAIDRMGWPVTIAPDQGRGATITVSTRFHPLADRLIPALEAAAIGTTVRQSGTGLVVDVYEPRDYPRELTEASGVVQKWKWNHAAPEATDVVVGGQGEGTARTFRAFAATDGRAEKWGDQIEVFRDARDTSAADVYAQRAAETFAETAEKTGLHLTLAETKHFRYGGTTGLHVGDRVRVRIGPELVVTDLLRSAAVSWTRDAGRTVTPKVGDIADSPQETMARAVLRTAMGIRDERNR